MQQGRDPEHAPRWYDFGDEALIRAPHVTASELAREVPSILLAPAESYVRPPAGFLSEVANPKMDRLNAEYAAQSPFRCPQARALVLHDAVVFDSGTVMTADGRLILDTFHPGNRTVVNRVFAVDGRSSEVPFIGAIPFVPGEHLLCKRIGLANYSHWLLEMFPRLPLVRDALGAGFDGVMPVVPAAKEPMKGVVEESLDWLGLGRRWMATDNAYVGRFERLLVPYGLSKHPFWLHPAAVRRIESLHLPEPAADRWLFVSRKDADKRRLQNEDEVFRRLKSAFPQFRRVTLAGRSLENQRQRFGRARVVVAVMGGSWGNIVFSARGGHCVCIGPAPFSDLFFRNLAAQKEMRYLEVRGTPVGPELHADFTLSPASVDAVIDFLGNTA